MSVSVKNLAGRTPAPRFAYATIARRVLPGWDLSLVFVEPRNARALNKKLRNKTYTPNVLSYSVGPQSGEIFICITEAEKQASSYGMSKRQFILYLFIHALLHLEGGAHGVTMEKRTLKLLAKFVMRAGRALPSLHEATHRDRNRHRHLPGKTGRRRGTH